MLQFNPINRLEIADIIGHPWMRGEMPCTETARAELANRHAIVVASKELNNL